MGTTSRNNVRVFGRGTQDMIFAHGYGCDQSIWRLLTPHFEETHRLIVYDLVGTGASDVGAYDRKKYSSLAGHAKDLLEVIEQHALGPVIFVGHSVSAMIGLLAGNMKPEKFAKHIMIAPSARYLNDADYVGGFSHADIDSLLDTLDANYLGWASVNAPVIMGSPSRPELGAEFTRSLHRTDPEVAKHFARVTFASDHRADLPKSTIPTLVIPCSKDPVAPVAVGQYLQAHLRNSSLRVIENVGHLPHLSTPSALASLMKEYLVA